MGSPRIPSAKLLQRRENKIAWNKAAIDALQLGIADAMAEIGDRIVADVKANAPRDRAAAAIRESKSGHPVEMMADTGHRTVWALGKLAVGDPQLPAGKNKPHGAKVPADQVVMFATVHSRLAHLVELGTIKMNARPFLVPAFNRNVSGVASIIVPAMGKRIRGMPASLWAPARTPKAQR